VETGQAREIAASVAWQILSFRHRWLYRRWRIDVVLGSAV